MAGKTVVPMEIEPPRAWLSWTGATTSCLRALGVDCDRADVAGYAGYAFSLSIQPGLCPSGPTMVDWNLLSNGVLGVGRSACAFTSFNCHTPSKSSDISRAHCKAVFDMVTREIEAGRPCVVWGLGVPEFGVVRGIEGETYLCVKAGPTPERVAWDQLNAPGGPYCLTFPTAREKSTWEDNAAVHGALYNLQRPNLNAGLRAYDLWQQELRNDRATTWSNAYNAQCWAEARHDAAVFTDRLAGRHASIAEPMRQAHGALADTAEHLGAVAKLFPFTGKFEQETVSDPDVIASACEHLGRAREADARAIEALSASIEALLDHSPAEEPAESASN